MYPQLFLVLFIVFHFEIVNYVIFNFSCCLVSLAFAFALRKLFHRADPLCLSAFRNFLLPVTSISCNLEILKSLIILKFFTLDSFNYENLKTAPGEFLKYTMLFQLPFLSSTHNTNTTSPLLGLNS